MSLGVATVAVLIVLAIANVMSNRILPEVWYVPWNLAVAVAVVLIARPFVTRRELGFVDWLRGLRVGAVLMTLTALVMLIGLAMPALNDLFHDRRVGAGVLTLLYQAVIRIPLGTVVLEEIAFRSVLPALFGKRIGVVGGSLAASAVFGAWHVLPAWSINTVNPVAADVFGDGAIGRVAGITFAVVGTMIAGLWLCLIRYRSRSVLAPMLGHVATNTFGFVIAWFVTAA